MRLGRAWSQGLGSYVLILEEGEVGVKAYAMRARLQV